MFQKNSLDVRSVFVSLFGIHFRERTFVFLVLLWFDDCQWCFAYNFVLCFGFSLPDMFQRSSLNIMFSFVAFGNPLPGANFRFSCLVVVCCFLVAFCPCFCFVFWLYFAPGHALGKFS